MFVSIEILRALACLLIVNYHCYGVYPSDLSALSFGGDIGNNTFFLISGFLLYPSVVSTDYKSMPKWLGKRYVKIIPLLLVFDLLTYFLSSDKSLNGNLFSCFIFPTFYWFASAVVLFYPIFFIFVKFGNKMLTIMLFMILIGLHLYYDSLNSERYYIGFMAMLCGAWIRSVLDNKRKEIRPKVWIVSSIITFGIYVLLKVLLQKSIGDHRVIHLLVGVMIIIFAAGVIIILYNAEDRLKKIKRFTFIYSIISSLSRMTLAVYLCQCFLNSTALDVFNRLGFPLSFLVYLVCVFILGYVVYYIDDLNRNRF